MTIHTVAPGNTISSIASQYGVSPLRLAADNGITDTARLVVGQTLVINIPKIVHITESGETLYSIASQYNTSVNALLRNNPSLIGNTALTVGEEVVISFQGDKLGTINVNGYAYPFINKQLLVNVLPYLTSLTIFGYGFDNEGNLEIPDDEETIRLAYAYSAVPIMLISAMQNGMFDTNLATNMFRNSQVQENLINNILEMMRLKGYLGLDVDFEFIEPDDAQVYQDFLRNITQRLNSEGYTVNADLAPKTSADQRGLLYEAHRYGDIAAIVDTVLLMTYEWGYMYSAPMAVAPIPSVRRVLDYAVSEIPREKIYMGIPNYGYDWTLPYVQGTPARVIGNNEAVRIAADYNAVIQFDETAQTPFFRYVDGSGRQHEVWFEDARSIDAKLRMINEYNFLGAGYWNVMRPFNQNWLVLNGLFDIAKVI